MPESGKAERGPGLHGLASLPRAPSPLLQCSPLSLRCQQTKGGTSIVVGKGEKAPNLVTRPGSLWLTTPGSGGHSQEPRGPRCLRSSGHRVWDLSLAKQSLENTFALLQKSQKDDS